jgi:hypothetical protein
MAKANALSVVIVLHRSRRGIETGGARCAVGAARALRALRATNAGRARTAHDTAQTGATIIAGATTATREADGSCSIKRLGLEMRRPRKENAGGA